MRVVIHADASRAGGTGHVVRCLALAAELRRQGADVVMASEELLEPLADAAALEGVTVVRRREAPRRPDWVVVDGYHLDAGARRALADRGVPRLVVDDLGGEVDADVVLNQNLYASPASPTRAPRGELVAGPSFALLRPEFVDAVPERDQPPIATRLLVTMGGSDPHDATTAVVRALRDLEPRMETRVVIGAGHPSPDLVEAGASDAGFTVVRGAPTLQPHLRWTDMVVSACGTTVLEAVRLGRPLVGVILADNQLAVADAVERERLGRVVGRHPTLDADRLRTAVEQVREDAVDRAVIAARGPELVDGRGAQRVAAVLTDGPLRLRDATIVDADLLLGWRNDPATRAASFNQSPVDPETHMGWLRDRLGSDEERIWIGEVNGTAVGVVRFALEASRATASVTVAPESRGHGLAGRLIIGGCARLASEEVADAVDAWIRPENVASVAAFRVAGFRPAASEAGRLRFSLSLRPVR